jgi:hypothetical protein
LLELPGLVADLGDEYIDLSPDSPFVSFLCCVPHTFHQGRGT